MAMEPLDLSHRPLLHPLLKTAGVTLSEFSFANLFLFRRRHNYRVSVEGTAPFITGETYDGLRFAMPAGDLRRLPAHMMEEMLAAADALFPIPQEWLTLFDSERFVWTCQDGDADYIYPTEQICTFQGRKMHAKKNLRNQFVAQHRHQGRPLTIERIPDALAILDSWQTDSGLPHQDTDYAACREALQLSEELQLCGGIYYAEDLPAGFILGEELGQEMFVLHFAKALIRFKGIYQFLFSSFACILPGHYRRLNLEQDLGQEGLRASKQSYAPEFLQKKYRVSRRR